MNPTTTRRDVLKLGLTAAVTAAVGASPRLSVAADDAPAKKVPIGVQLYSVRNELKTDFPGVISQIGKMGFEGVEFAGYYGWDEKPKELRKLLDDSGLKTCGTHTHYPTLIGDYYKRTVELHKTLGNRFLICPYMEGKTAAAWDEWVKKFNDLAAKAKEDDMLVGYHAHAGDFKKFPDGRTPWEIFFDGTDKSVIHQIDIGNTLGGGGDPLAMVKKYPGRTKSAHIKEHGGAKDAAIGEGTVDWKTYLPVLEQTGGIEWYIVEHETGTTPLVSIKTCLENLHKMGR